MWLEVGNSNSDPAIVTEYYLECVETLGYASRWIRCDLGTENSTLKHLHPFLTNNQSVIFGKSTSNQRIEAWWSILRKSVTTWWINLFKDQREMNLFNDVDKIHVECLKYCFMDIIKKDLQTFMQQWNCHLVRKEKNSDLPAGKPEIMHFAPEIFGSKSYELPVLGTDANRCRQLFGKLRSEISYMKEFEELVKQVILNVRQPNNASEAL